MPQVDGEQPFEIEDLSRGVQRKTTRFFPRPGEVMTGENARFNVLGGISKGLGYSQRASALTTTTSTSSSTSTTTTSSSTSTSSSSSTSTSTS